MLTFEILRSYYFSGKVVVELSKVELIQAAVILHLAWVTVDDIMGMDLNGSHCITFSRALYEFSKIVSLQFQSVKVFFEELSRTNF